MGGLGQPMTLYEYRCQLCGHIETSDERADDLRHRSHVKRGEVLVCSGLLRRVWAVNFAPVMQEHFNSTVQRPISSMRQFEQELRRASDEASERTGIDHRFAPVDPTDRKALGVTSDGLEATNRTRQANGLRPVPLD